MATQRPGWPTRGAAHLLGLLRDAGLPFLRSSDDAAIRTLALGVRAAARRTIAGPLRFEGAGDGEPEIEFADLGADESTALLTDNSESFRVKCAIVEAAERSVDCALFYLADDETGSHFADVLSRAARRGVGVRVGVDLYASIEKQHGPFGYATNPTRGALVLLERLRDAGCQTYLMGNDRWCMHRKFLFVDGTRLLLGGCNVADHYAEPGWRDLELLFEGAYAGPFAGAVESTFTSPTEPPSPARGIVAGVPGTSGRGFARAITTLAEQAEATIDIEHAYLLSHPWLLDVLRTAVQRGVRVRALTNSGASNDLPFMNWRLAKSSRELLDAGVRVYLRSAGSATLHTKLVVADERRVVFGSSNLDYYSPTYCAELDVAVESSALGAWLTAVFEAGLSSPTAEEVLPGTPAAAALERECTPWSVSRVCDLVLHDIQ